MDMSNFSPELHVAQQSRRDKLRIQHDSSPSLNNLGSYTNNTEQISDLRHRNVCYDSTGLCAEMFNFVSNSQAFMPHKDGLMVHQQPEKWVGEASFGNFSQAISSTFNTSATVNCDPQYFSTWKSIGSQTSREWIANQSPTFVGDSFSGSSSKVINTTHVSTLDVKPYLGYQELNSSSENSNLNGQKPFGDMHCSSSFYPSEPHGIASNSSNVQSFGQEMTTIRQKSFEESSHVPWVVGGGELVLLPTYADQLPLKSASDLIRRAVDGCQSSCEFDYAATKNTDVDMRTIANDKSITQVLSLSLSSIPSPRVNSTQIDEGHTSSDLHSANNNVRDFGNWKPEYLTTIPKLSTVSNVIGNARHETMGTPVAITQRNPGPLGPFTGYATILKSSKFLRPAQQLLDELCSVACSMHVEICTVSDKILEEVAVSCDVVSVAEPGVKVMAGDSSSLSFTFNCSNEKSWELGGMSSSTDSYQPENLQKKAKLLCMQDEVCKRYKQYHQQMQMVFSSFKTVAGLSAATPCISLALKMVSKHFRFLKNAITDHLKSIRNALGEDLSSPTVGRSGSKGHDTSALMLKFFDQSFQKQKSGANTGIIESQHVWRLQRGLPECAVLILRAWLFDHFLHPYPTDNDKHMLASQTGLTRNQVSNWFINARVRVWKPMVEEIHMLETKGVIAETGSNAGKADGKLVTKGRDQLKDQSLNGLSENAVSDKQLVECSRTIPPECKVDRSNSIVWNQEKRSRIEYHIPESMDGSLMGFGPSHHSGIDIDGLGAVSLTLGLRQNAESAQQEHQLRQYFRGQNTRDFVG